MRRGVQFGYVAEDATGASKNIRFSRRLHEEPVAGAEAECLLWDRVQKPKGGRAEVYFRRKPEAWRTATGLPLSAVTGH